MRRRSCPLCGSNDDEPILELEAESFCRTNSTYSDRFRTLLGLPAGKMFPIVRCRACGMHFAALLPDDAFFTTLYEHVIQRPQLIAGSEDHASYARRLRYVAELLELAPRARPLRALDYGSGLGVTLRILGACGVEATGFDPSAIRVDYMRERHLTVVGDEATLAGPFAIVVLDNVLEHLPEPVATVDLLAALTAPGTVAYVSVPPYETRFMRTQIARHRRGEAIDMSLNPWEHLNYFSLGHLDALLLRGGFRRLTAQERVSPPSIGLRAERATNARVRNMAASLLRLVRYGFHGDVMASAEHAFYRRDAGAAS